MPSVGPLDPVASCPTCLFRPVAAPTKERTSEGTPRRPKLHTSCQFNRAGVCPAACWSAPPVGVPPPHTTSATSCWWPGLENQGILLLHPHVTSFGLPRPLARFPRLEGGAGRCGSACTFFAPSLLVQAGPCPVYLFAEVPPARGTVALVILRPGCSGLQSSINHAGSDHEDRGPPGD